MAERLRNGMNAVLERHNVVGYVYGPSSVFHIYLQPPSATTPVKERSDLVNQSATALKSMDGGLIQALQNGFRLRGVELLSYNGGMTSAVHTEQDIDNTIDAFDDLVRELVAQGALRRM